MKKHRYNFIRCSILGLIWGVWVGGFLFVLSRPLDEEYAFSFSIPPKEIMVFNYPDSGSQQKYDPWGNIYAVLYQEFSYVIVCCDTHDAIHYRGTRRLIIEGFDQQGHLLKTVHLKLGRSYFQKIERIVVMGDDSFEVTLNKDFDSIMAWGGGVAVLLLFLSFALDFYLYRGERSSN